MKSRKLIDKVAKNIFGVTGFLCVLLLVSIFTLLTYNSLHAFINIPVKAFFALYWNPLAFGKSSFGVFQLLWSSLLVTVGAMAIAMPLGIGTAAYMAEIAHPRIKKILRVIVEILAGIPSVTIGFVGVVLIGPAIAEMFNLNNGFNALNGSILLAFMSLPTIITVSEDAMTAVPHSFKEASIALGANRWLTLIKVIIPSAYSGIIAAVILGFGRAIGETMTVLMVTGNATTMPHSYFDPVRTLQQQLRLNWVKFHMVPLTI